MKIGDKVIIRFCLIVEDRPDREGIVVGEEILTYRNIETPVFRVESEFFDKLLSFKKTPRGNRHYNYGNSAYWIEKV
jgi:hypothetical protein